MKSALSTLSNLEKKNNDVNKLGSQLTRTFVKEVFPFSINDISTLAEHHVFNNPLVENDRDRIQRIVSNFQQLMSNKINTEDGSRISNKLDEIKIIPPCTLSLFQELFSHSMYEGLTINTDKNELSYFYSKYDAEKDKQISISGEADMVIMYAGVPLVAIEDKNNVIDIDSVEWFGQVAVETEAKACEFFKRTGLQPRIFMGILTNVVEWKLCFRRVTKTSTVSYWNIKKSADTEDITNMLLFCCDNCLTLKKIIDTNSHKLEPDEICDLENVSSDEDNEYNEDDSGDISKSLYQKQRNISYVNYTSTRNVHHSTKTSSKNTNDHNNNNKSKNITTTMKDKRRGRDRVSSSNQHTVSFVDMTNKLTAESLYYHNRRYSII